MNAKFRAIVSDLDQKLKRLRSMPPVKLNALPRTMPKRGVYLLSQGSRHLYVGRTNRLRQRLHEHRRLSANHFSATFAFLIARHSTGRKKATYTKEGSRAKLAASPRFGRAFARARAQVARMDVRWVAEPRQVQQALLEIYAAIELGTKYNDFDTH